ncbi:MAG: MerR family transcriptional regulator [Cyclobacteriaceae bacterium]|nr:MerR family transcriptional regulator [Cyclobacteriaceae bacterium]MCH8515427.1 MerR family transcriptional regulator [Cyclobacteriaceae bacterium]
MIKYSIKDLEELSGIKAHTLRVWEQRYNFINPKRTNSNIRYYDQSDLKLILNVSILKESGMKISHIAKLSEEEMNDQILKITQRDLEYPDQVQALTLSMLQFDENRFEKILSGSILKIGFEDTMINIIYPFLSKIGILWQTGSINPAQEHFISNLIRQKLIVAIDGQYVEKNADTPKVLVYLPENEMHEISLLFATYIYKSRGNHVLYLGQNVPFDDVIKAYNFYQPDYIFSIFTCFPENDRVESYIKRMDQKLPESKIILAGYKAVQLQDQVPERFHIINRMDEIRDLASTLQVKQLS